MTQARGHQQFTTVEAKLNTILNALKPGCDVYFLDKPDVDATQPQEVRQENAIALAYLEAKKKATHENSYLLQKTGDTFKLYWVDSLGYDGLKEVVIPTDDLLALYEVYTKAQVEPAATEEKSNNDNQILPLRLNDELAAVLLGMHPQQQKYNIIQNYRADKKKGGYQVPLGTSDARDALQAQIDAVILARSEQLFDQMFKRIQQRNTLEIAKAARYQQPYTLQTKVSHMLDKIKALTATPEGRSKHIVELTTVLEATDKILDPEQNATAADIQAYQTLAKTIQGAQNESMRSLGDAMFCVGSFMLLYGALLILLALTPPPIVIGLLCVGIAFAGTGAIAVPLGIGFFAGGRTTGISKAMNVIGDEVRSEIACVH